MRQLEIKVFVSPYISLAYIFEVSYSTLVTWVSKNQELTNQNSRNNWCHIVRRTICQQNQSVTEWYRCGKCGSMDKIAECLCRNKVEAGEYLELLGVWHMVI